jgi:hypothetical protein
MIPVSVLAIVASGVTLTLVTVPALITALAKGKARRDAAYRVLRLLLNFLRRPANPR